MAFLDFGGEMKKKSSLINPKLPEWPEPHIPTYPEGECISDLPQEEKIKVWREMHPEIKKVLGEFDKVFGKPERVYYRTTD